MDALSGVSMKSAILLLLLPFFAHATSLQTAVFAGGCFWCMQASFDFLKKDGGVISNKAGYTGGRTTNPTYKQVSAGDTGHREAIEVVFDSGKISYERLLEVFWSNIDPLDATGQFCDKGDQYKSAIYYLSPAQKTAAEKSLKDYAAKMKLKGKIATEILPAKKFYVAEDYHQNFDQKNPERYKAYKEGCGRDGRLKEVWGVKK
jgi:peptide-methionine (S)-S-oxide reductase